MELNRKIRTLNHKRLDKTRAFKIRAARWLFANFSRFHEYAENGDTLVLRLDGKLGDSVTATGFLRELKAGTPNGKLIVVTGKESAAVFKNLNYVDSVLVSEKGFFSTLKLLGQLSKFRFNSIINTSHILNVQVIFLVSFIKSFKKIGLAQKNLPPFSEQIDVSFGSDHIVNRYEKILKSLNHQPANMRYDLTLKTAETAEARGYVESLRQKSKYVIALNSFAGARLRNLNKDTTLKIVERLLSSPDLTVVSLANQGDHRILNEWIDGRFPNWQHNERFYSFDQNVALLSQCDLIITPDTAWVHIACALEKPLVAIYREDTNPSEVNSIIWAPYKTPHSIVFARALPPNPDDINNVNVDEIVAHTLAMLGLRD